MRPVFLCAVALAAAVCASASAMAQEAAAPEFDPAVEEQLRLSSGLDLWPLAQALIEATRSEVAFAAAHDTRYRVVHHLETGFTCAFIVGSQAAVAVVAVDDLAKTGDDTVCIEEINGVENSYRISRLPGMTIDEVFTNAQATAAGYLSGDILQVESAPNMTHSPEQPDVALDMERRQILLVGDTESGPAMLRIAVARRPGDWYITQHYFGPLRGVEQEQLPTYVMLASAAAEGAFAVRLGELLHPTIDPRFATGADGEILQ